MPACKFWERPRLVLLRRCIYPWDSIPCVCAALPEPLCGVTPGYSPPPESGRRTLSVDVLVFAPDGRTIASVEGLHLKRATREALQKPAPDPHQDWLYEIEWQARPLAGRLPPDYLPAPADLSTRLSPQLAEAMSRPSGAFTTRF